MVTEIVETILNTITGLMAGIGRGITNYFTSVFLTADGGVSGFGTFMFVLLGIGAAFGLATLIFNIIKGKKA